MPLTAKQQRALGKVTGPRRASMLRGFEQQQPRPRPQPSRRRPNPPRAIRSSGAIGAARGGKLHAGHLFDPRDGRLVPVVHDEGPAFPITGIATHAFGNDATNNRMYCITNPGVSGSIILEAVASATPSFSVSTIPVMSAAPSAGGPTSARPMKIGFSLVNSALPLNTGGRVYVLKTNQRITSPDPAFTSNTQAELQAMMDTIRDHPDTKLYSAVDFTRPKHFYSAPRDFTSYHDYLPFLGSISTTSLGTAATTASIPTAGESGGNFGMEALWVVVDATSAAQTWTLRARAAYYARFPVETVAGQAQRPVPTTSATALNQAKHVAEVAGDIGLGAMMLKGAKTFAGRLGSLVGESGLAAEAESLAPLLI